MVRSTESTTESEPRLGSRTLTSMVSRLAKSSLGPSFKIASSEGILGVNLSELLVSPVALGPRSSASIWATSASGGRGATLVSVRRTVLGRIA